MISCAERSTRTDQVYPQVCHGPTVYTYPYLDALIQVYSDPRIFPGEALYTYPYLDKEPRIFPSGTMYTYPYLDALI